MKALVHLLLLFSTTLAFAYKADYPQHPEPELTPGSLCDRPDQYRYPERIAYCERDVNRYTKDDIFDSYRRAGYRLKITKRADYKIDHYIPLCAGGSNHEDNLWPQHVSVFTITDPLESLGCEKLRHGLITQKKLVELIKRVKLDTRQAPQAMSYLRSL